MQTASHTPVCPPCAAQWRGVEPALSRPLTDTCPIKYIVNNNNNLKSNYVCRYEVFCQYKFWKFTGNSKQSQAYCPVDVFEAGCKM